MLLSILCSCQSALDRVPKDSLSPDTFFKNRAECELFTNTFSTVIPGGSGVYGETADVTGSKRLMDEITGLRTIGAKDGNWTCGKMRDINTYL